MKKVFLTLALVFATGTMMNATTISEDVRKDCIGFAFDLEEIVGKMDYETFSAVVDLCEAL